ncbi:hypothetical protein [Chitinophaga varians]|uniref:hypothetical protein n=1 Tax=Chitinophaga varians TaxID=2202339 RepID=UPI00165F7257|nr:hypothetical protein [Chitinophaga varians]MBC9914574.1 hypothetical protein [Chitinophaga varians]
MYPQLLQLSVPVKVKQVLVFPVVLFIMVFSNKANAQKLTEQELTNRLNKINSILSGRDTSNYVSSHIFDTIINDKQKMISGIQVRDGKIASTSVSIQDKSVTFNLAIGKNNFFIQPSITGSSSKDFVSVFTGDKYQRTLTGGLNFQWFFNKRAFFDRSDRVYLHNQLRFEEAQFTPQKGTSDETNRQFVAAFDSAYQLYANMAVYDVQFTAKSAFCTNKLNNKDTIISYGKGPVDSLRRMYELAPKLVKKGILPVDWDQKYPKKVYALVRKIDTTLVDDSIASNQQRLLGRLNELQQIAPWNSFYYWWVSGGVQINQATNAIFNPGAGIKELFKRDERDVFVSGQFSFNFFRNGKRNLTNQWLSITLKYTSQKKFDSKDQINIQAESLFPVNGDTVVAIGKSVSFYKNDVERKDYISMEIPFTYYWVNKKFGVDVAAGFDLSPKFDNLAARFGIYVPISSGDKVVTVEPLLKFINLNKSGLVFFQDQVTFGFSLSVAIPKFVSSK